MPDSIVSLFDDTQKHKLEGLAADHVYCAGHQLFQQGDDANKMYLVKKGKVTLYRLMPNGDEKLFRIFMSGEMIAEMAMFMQPRKYPMSAKVDQESVISAFHYQDVLQVVAHSPELSLKVMSFMSNKICNLMNSLDILTQVNASQRLVMKLAELYRSQGNKQGKVFIPVTKKLFATQLGMTPETLSRSFKKLKVDGYLVESENHVTLLDIPALCESVEISVEIFDSPLK